LSFPLPTLHKSPRSAAGFESGQNARRKRRANGGYAYIMALFMVTAVIIGSQIVLRNLVTESRSAQEQEMIWRGNQYARAIRNYYRKTGHYPTSQDDLLTAVPDVHFLRSEIVKDPMNKQDGEWRFIYTNASGAIIGSVKYGSMQQMALMDMNGGQMPAAQPASGANGASNSSGALTTPGGLQAPGGIGGTPASTAPSGQNSGSSFLGSGFSLSSGATSPTSTTTTGTTTGTVLGPLGQPVTATMAGPQPTGPVDGPVFGGQLIGVGSKVDRASVKVYKGGKKYNQWEFIWNPIEEQAMAMQQGMAPTGAVGQPGGAIPGFGGLPIAPIGGATGTTITTTTNSSNGSSGNSDSSGSNNNSSNSSP
jgi:hypothetical protein